MTYYLDLCQRNILLAVLQVLPSRKQKSKKSVEKVFDEVFITERCVPFIYTVEDA